MGTVDNIINDHLTKSYFSGTLRDLKGNPVPRKDVVDFGHKSGNSYNDMFQKYKNREITLDELKEFQFNPNNFRLETPSANRSRKF